MTARRAAVVALAAILLGALVAFFRTQPRVTEAPPSSVPPVARADREEPPAIAEPARVAAPAASARAAPEPVAASASSTPEPEPANASARGLAGVVTDARTGAPIERALVRAWRGYSDARAFTDARGRFLIDDAGIVTASAAIRVEAGHCRYEKASREDVALDGNASARVDLALSPVPTARLFGRVLDPDGKPVQGAFVSDRPRGFFDEASVAVDRAVPGFEEVLRREPEAADLVFAPCDPSGRYEIELRAGEWSLAPRARNGARVAKVKVKLEPGDVKELDLTLPLMAIVLIRPVLPAGESLEGVHVRLHRRFKEGNLSGEQTSDVAKAPNAEGLFEVPLDPAPAQLALEKGAKRSPWKDVEPRSGERLVVDIALAEDPGEARILRGVVVDAETRALLGGASITEANAAHPSRTVSEKDGSFSLSLAGPLPGAEELAEGTTLDPNASPWTLEEHALVVERTGYLTWVAPVPEDVSAPLEVRLVPEGTLDVTLVDSHEKPVARAHVLLQCWHSSEGKVTNENGVAHFDGLSGCDASICCARSFLDLDETHPLATVHLSSGEKKAITVTLPDPSPSTGGSTR